MCAQWVNCVACEKSTKKPACPFLPLFPASQLHCGCGPNPAVTKLGGGRALGDKNEDRE